MRRSRTPPSVRSPIGFALLSCIAYAACASGSSGDTGTDGSGATTSGAGGTGAQAGAAAAAAGAFANPAGSPGSITDQIPDGGSRGCNDLQVQFAPVIPTVLLLVDRSGSMWDSGYGASPTRWQAIYDSLMDPAMGVVEPFSHEVRFGLMTYTGDSTTHTCPLIESVPAALDNYAAIKQVYDVASTRPAFKADTPTGQGVRAATDALLAVTDDGPKFIVLITDGEPDTCATPDPSCGQDESIAAVQAAFAQGIASFVIGISSDVGTQHLQDVANAGAGLPVRAPDMQFTYNCINPGYATLGAAYAAAGQTPGTAQVYQPADGVAIANTLRALIRGVRGCSFALQGEVDLEHAGLGTVLLDDTALLYEDPNGWRMLDTRTLELVGDACARLQADASEFLVSFPCDVIEVF